MKKRKEASSFGVIGLGRFGMALAISLAEAGKDDPMFAELDKICKAHNGLWNAEAEKYLLANAKEI